MSRWIRRVLASSCTPISIAIVLMAHERTAFLDFVFGLGAFFRSLRILMHDQSIVPNCPPIRSPFPNVSDHVVKAKVIGRKRIYWTCTKAPIFFIIFLRKSASPNVGTILIVRLEFVTPRKKPVFFSSTTSIFPFCLGRETFSWKWWDKLKGFLLFWRTHLHVRGLTFPFTISNGVIPRYVHPRKREKSFLISRCKLGLKDINTYTGWDMRSSMLESGPSGCFQLAPAIGTHHLKRIFFVIIVFYLMKKIVVMYLQVHL